ncbi:MAG: NAD-dependent epimerase/dehydratase family protein [Acidimicrobiales bacterium]
MRILIIGGTSFVGRATVLAAVSHGHEVTVVNRGVTPNDLPASVTRLIGDRQKNLSVLEGLHFDATVDAIAYRPSDVDVLLAALGKRGGHHLQISSISAYQDTKIAGATEDQLELRADPIDLDTPITGSSYGPLKAASERRALECFDAPVTIVRPTYVLGGHDATLRFPYWVARLVRGGNVAVPGPSDARMQWIDARDLGMFVVTLLENSTTGAFHALGPTPAPHYGEFVEQVAARVAPAGTRLVAVKPETIVERGLGTYFPLWSGIEPELMMALDNRLALGAGLKLRSLEETVDDTLAWWGERQWPAHWLDANTEAELLNNG